MAGLQKLDKKQVPQVIGLGVLSVGLFGYFAFKMAVPTVSAAPTAKAPPAAGAAPAGTAKASGPADAATATASGPLADAPPPTPGMRDPFVAPALTASIAPPTPTAPTPTAQAATAQAATAALPATGGGLHVPFAPALPPGGGRAPSVPPTDGSVVERVAPMPVVPAAPAAPTWTLTGVLQSSDTNVAVLRDGGARKFARQGDIVSGGFRVVDMTRQFVVLQHGRRHYILPLGGPKTPPASPAAPAAAPPPAAAGAPPAGLPDPAKVNTLLNTMQQLAGKS